MHGAYVAARETGARAAIGFGRNPAIRRLHLRRGGRPLPILLHPRGSMITFHDIDTIVRGEAVAPPHEASTAPLSLASQVMRSARFVAVRTVDQFLLLDIERGKHYELEGAGGLIWSLIATPTLVADICTRLQAGFEVARDTCEHDVLALLEDMRREHIVLAGGYGTSP